MSFSDSRQISNTESSAGGLGPPPEDQAGGGSPKLRALFVVIADRDVPIEVQNDDSAVIVAARQQKQGLERQGVEVDYFPVPGRFSRLNFLKAGWKIFLLSLRGGLDRYDLVHAHYGFNGVVARCQFRRPVVITFMGSDVYLRWERRLAKLLARVVSAVIVPEGEMARLLRSTKTHVIPYGVDLDTFVSEDAATARTALGLHQDRKLVLFPYDPARVVKRHDLVMEAVARVPGAEVITIHGQPPAVVARYMSACDALVMASDREGSPVAVREALASDLPIVSVDVGDVGQLIGDVPGCRLCSQDVDEIAAALREVLDRGDRLTDGRTKVAPLGLVPIAEQVKAVYESVASRRRRAGAAHSASGPETDQRGSRR